MEVTAETLFKAADQFAARTDGFAVGKADICRDLGNKLLRFGSFASRRQYEFACKLVEWATPRQRAVQALAFPRIEALVREKDLALHLGVCKVVQFSSGVVGVVSAIVGAANYGVIENDGTFRRLRECTDEIVAVLRDVEERGVEAVKAIGRATGRCCVCSRTLTQESSITAGIGPICATKF